MESEGRNRTCRAFGASKPETREFYYVSRGRVQSVCKDCFRRRKNERYQRDPERAREIARRSYRKVDGAAAKRRARAADLARYEAIADRHEIAHADERQARRVARHLANRELNNERSRDWYHANRERAIRTALEWIAANPDRAKVNTERMRAQRRAASGTLTTEEWLERFRLFEGRCAYCLAPGATKMDHLVPLALGGTHTADNVVPACKACNRSKWKRRVPDWIAERERRGQPLRLDPDDALRVLRGEIGSANP